MLSLSLMKPCILLFPIGFLKQLFFFSMKVASMPYEIC